MDELIERLVATTGVERPVAQKAVGIILDFSVKQGPTDKVQDLIAQMPAADALLQSARGEGSSGFFRHHGCRQSTDGGRLEHGSSAERNPRGGRVRAREGRRRHARRERRSHSGVWSIRLMRSGQCLPRIAS